ncbi:HAD family hydrolase [Thermococcus sp.]|uniref:HAD family hydrolase n=1 Tax=Thermococcus sp. TaxID=35749 RepID=UPI002621B64E|nr:hydrolase [Thermococcus sp.]
MGYKWVVFDVDGVLIDVRESYDIATKLTAEFFLGILGRREVVCLDHVRKFRLKGSFGDDFKVSEALVILALAGDLGRIESLPDGVTIGEIRDEYGIGLETEDVERVFNTFYLGEQFDGMAFPSRGLWRKEKPIVKRGLLRELEKRYKTGVLTGRSKLELKLAEEIIGYRFKRAITRELYLKPDPRALWELVGGEYGVYIGDTRNDELLVENYRREYGEFDFIMVGRDVSNVNQAIEEILALNKTAAGSDVLSENSLSERG